MRQIKKIMICSIAGLLFGMIVYPMINAEVSNSKTEKICVIYDDAEVPLWEVGNYWIYNIDIVYEAMGAYADVTLENILFEVINIESENYTLDINGDIAGSVSLAGIIEGNLRNAYISGKEFVRKSDLAIEKLFDVHIEGDIERQFVTNAFWADLEMKQNVTSIASPYDFPITVNKTWSVPITTYWLYLKAAVDLAIPYEIFYDFPIYIEEHTMTCLGKETVTVPAGTFKDALHISGASSHYDFWYTPIAGNLVKATYDDIRAWYNESLYWDISKLDVELLETNFRAFSNPPYSPSNPSPPNESINVSVNTNLSWTGGDPDGDSVLYDIYLGTDMNPPKIISGHSQTTYSPGKLKYSSTYYWRIVAFDDYGYSTNGSIWTFQTENATNSPPNKPLRPSGTTAGAVNVSYTYSSSAVDIDNDRIYYLFEWGDGTNSNWLGPFSSGETIEASHIWDREGSYNIKVKAKDIYDAESEWSDPLVVSMPKSIGLVEVSIIKPMKNTLYAFDRILMPLPHGTVIIGNITVIASAISVVGIDTLEFYVNGALKHTETNRLSWLLVTWNWDETILFRHLLRVVAYDNFDSTASDEIEVWIFNVKI